jgi:hypothetical protein
MEDKGDVRNQFLRSLSNYSECIKPYLRTAQDRYVAGYYMVEGQDFDFNAYCKIERDQATSTSNAYK